MPNDARDPANDLDPIAVVDEFRVTLLVAPDGTIEGLLETAGIDGLVPALVVGRTLMEVAALAAGDPSRSTLWSERIAELQQATTPVRWIDSRPGTDEGTIASVAYTATPIRDRASGTLAYVLLEVRDGSRETRTEALLRERAEQLRAALEVTGLGRYTFYPSKRTMVADSRLSEIVGMDVEDLMRSEGLQGFFDNIHQDDQAMVQAGIEAALAGGPDYDVEYRMRRPSPSGDEERWIAARGRVEFDDDGVPLRMIGVIDDITQRREQAERQLRSQKREAIGTLAGGIAHDFNNVISAILSNAAVAQTELATGASPATSISEIAQGAERAADIVRRLLAFSREEPDARHPFDLGVVAREACALSQATLRAGVRLDCRAADDLPPVYGSSTELHQVVINLVNNAASFVDPVGGEVIVDVRSEPGQGGAPDQVTLRVVDNGPGIAPSIRHRIFDPFFTTKDVGEGTGLGLAAAQTIVRGHGGEITAGDNPGDGAVFTVTLPVSPRPLPTPPEASAPLPPGPVARLRVLFVDDEPALVLLAERALPHRGFHVWAYTGPEAALRALEADPDAFDAVITDLSMPGMTGLELIEKLREIRPALPAVLSSGFMTHETRAQADALGVDAVVPKPCSTDDLADAVLRVCPPVAR